MSTKPAGGDFKLGALVKDIVTGFEGIAVTQLESIDGTVSIGVRPPYSKTDGKVPGVEYISSVQLEKIGDGVTVKPQPKQIGFI